MFYNIELTVCDSCNCNCDYCFENKNHSLPINNDLQCKTLLLLKKLCDDLTENDTVSILFWGGEPLMNLDYIKKILDITSKHDNIFYMIYSNGTLSDKWNELLKYKDLDFFRKHFSIRISYDGEPHNGKFRKYNKDNFIKTLDLLHENNINFKFNGTLTVQNSDMLPLMWKDYETYYYKYGTQLRFNIDTMKDDDSSLMSFNESLKHILPLEFDFFKKNGYPLFPWFDRTAENTYCDFNNTVAIHSDGNMYQCHGGQYTRCADKISFGNIMNIDDLRPYFKTYDCGEKNKECEECEAVHCFICHMAQLKDPNSPNDVVQQWNKCRAANKKRCEYYKLIGRYYKILWEAIYADNKKILNAFFDNL